MKNEEEKLAAAQELYDSIKDENDGYGFCGFCGQLISVRASMTLEENAGLSEDVLATRICDCKDARKARERREEEARRAEDRERTLIAAHESICSLFAPDPDTGFLSCTEEVIKHIFDAGVLIYDGKLGSASITDHQGITCKIKRTKDLGLSFTRSESYKRSEEV